MLLAGALGLIASPEIGLAAPQQQQQQGQSVAEAARKAKEQQKTAPKAATVWTNETIGTVQASINVVGQPSSAAASTTSPAAAPPTAEDTGAAAPPEVSAEDLARVQSQLDDARKELASLKTDLDLLQRKYDLDAAQYYGTPNYAANQKGQTMLNGEKSAIAAKKPAVDAAQKKVDELEKQFKALGGKPASAPAKPQS
jgi:hypothetical protein